jgi:BlaI family transcriptional regulator, penicillinase repressor
MARERKQTQPSDAEWKVLHALWRRHPTRARELLADLSGETGWAYTTLKTLLDRMLEKGLVSTEMRGHTAWYEPAVEQKRARKTALRDMIDRVFEGAAGPLLAHLVDHESLTRGERKRLATLIEEVERKQARRG